MTRDRHVSNASRSEQLECGMCLDADGAIDAVGVIGGCPRCNGDNDLVQSRNPATASGKHEI